MDQGERKGYTFPIRESVLSFQFRAEIINRSEEQPPRGLRAISRSPFTFHLTNGSIQGRTDLTICMLEGCGIHIAFIGHS
jgi:hypothetical protein